MFKLGVGWFEEDTVQVINHEHIGDPIQSIELVGALQWHELARSHWQ